LIGAISADDVDVAKLDVDAELGTDTGGGGADVERDGWGGVAEDEVTV
jgi:hypothetical protein